MTDSTAGASNSAGQSEFIAFLSNENVTFAGNASGQVATTTANCNVVAYTGTTKVVPAVGTVSGVRQMSGRLTVPITSP